MSSLIQKCVFSRPEVTGKWGPHGIEILIFRNAKNEINQRIELKEYMKKMGVMFTNAYKMVHFMYLLLNNSKISLGKIFNSN